MRQEAVVVLRLDQGNVGPASQAAARNIGKIGEAGQISARQTTNAMRQLPAQFTDIATQLAGGQNPFLILLQQGGQIKDSFGGIGAAVRGIGAAINPVSLAVGGVAAVLGSVAVAAFQGARESAKLRDTLILTGNAAGLTEDRLASMAGRIEQATQQTIGESRQLVVELAATGQVAASVMESTATAVARIADLSGKETAEIAGRFANQLRQPSRVAAELNRTYNFLNVAQATRIKQLEREGKMAEAANYTNELLNESLRGQKRELGFLETLWDSVTKQLSRFKEAALALGRDDTPGQAVEASRARLAELRAQLEENLSRTGRRRGESSIGGQVPFNRALRDQIAAEEARLAELEAAFKAAEKAADTSAARAKASSRIDDILNSRPTKERELREATPRADPATLAAVNAIAQTDVSRLADLNAQLQRLSELQNEPTTIAPSALAEAIATTREEIEKLSAIDLTTAILDPLDQMKQDFLRSEKAAYDSIDKYLADQAERAAAQLEKFRERAQQNIQDAVGDTFTRALDGEFNSIGDLWGALIKRMLAEALAADFASALFNKGSGGNVAALFSSFIGLFNGDAAPGFASAAGISGSRATGGPVRRGEMYEVNERDGPGELLRVGRRTYLMAAQDGQVIPTSGEAATGAAAATSGAASGAGVTFNLINQGRPMEVAGTTQRQTPQGTVVDVLLKEVASDIRRGGEVGRAMTGTFPGLNRATSAPRRG